MVEPSQKAAILWDGKTETLILSSSVKPADLEKFAWILPLKSRVRPQVKAADTAVFEMLTNYFGPEARHNTGAHEKGLAIEGGWEAGVSVVESAKIDIYDIAVLKATRAGDLLSWLKAHGYQAPQEAGEVFGTYIGKGGCYFVVNQVDFSNKYSKEIQRLQRRYAQMRQECLALAGQMNQGLAQLGVPLQVENYKAAVTNSWNGSEATLALKPISMAKKTP